MPTATGPGGITTAVPETLTIQGDLIIKDQQGKVRIRLDSQTGNVFIHDAQGNLIFLWDASGNNLRFGGHNQDGDLVLFPHHTDDINKTNEATLHFNADEGTILLGGNQANGRVICKDKAGNQNIFLDGAAGSAVIGANGQDGEVLLQNKDSKTTISLRGESATIRIGANGQPGAFFIQNKKAEPTIHLNSSGGTQGDFAQIRAGGNGSSSSISLFAKGANNVNDINQASVAINAESASLSLGGAGAHPGQLFIVGPSSTFQFQSSDGAIRAGGGPNGGSLLLFPDGEGASSTPNEATMNLNAQTGKVRIGGGSGDSPVDGAIAVHNKFNNGTISLAGANANIRAGGHGTGGDILLYSNAADDLSDNKQSSIHLDAQVGTVRVGGGTHGISGNVIVRNNANQTTIHLDGQAGDIILQNADCAEDFELATDVQPPAGSVMVIDAEGKLHLSDRPYDRRVAGIIAGAGELKPGIILGRKHSSNNSISAPIALAGRVYCKVDASPEPIQVGDLLTTSHNAGVAMKASDQTKAFGAVLGKALASLDQGIGTIPVLVALQ